jgi:YgiT-type zinc finger domain-containing protein
MTTQIKHCPMCGSHKVHRVRRDVKIDVGRLHYAVPSVSFDECPQCGEEFFDLAAMEKFESHRPGAIRRKLRRRSA